MTRGQLILFRMGPDSGGWEMFNNIIIIIIIIIILLLLMEGA